MYQLIKLNNHNKKYLVITPEGKRIRFGDSRYEDYTTHKDRRRRENYLKRHSKEDHTDLTKAGTWSRYILWEKKTIREAIKHMQDLFDIKISLVNKEN